LLAVIGYVGFALVNAGMIPDYAATDRVFPLFVASVTLAGALVLLVQMMLRPEADPLFADREREDGGNSYGLWPTLAWFAGLWVLTALAGFILALAVFLFAFMRLRAGMGAGFSAAYTAAGLAFMMAMAWALGRDFPPGLLQDAVTLPWPLG
jgi:hypothetical protein